MVNSDDAKQPPRVVIVDDDRALRDRLQQVLEKDGYLVSQAPSGLRLLSLLEVDRPEGTVEAVVADRTFFRPEHAEQRLAAGREATASTTSR